MGLNGWVSRNGSRGTGSFRMDHAKWVTRDGSRKMGLTGWVSRDGINGMGLTAPIHLAVLNW